MVPASFPKKAPYVRIINRNTDFMVDEFYRPLVSPNDPKSYILNDRLNQSRTWDMNKSIVLFFISKVNVIIESYDLLRNKFPFSKPVSQINQYSNNQVILLLIQGGWGVQSPWDTINKPKVVNQNNYQYGNQGYNNGGMTNYNQPQMNRPPIPFNQNNLTRNCVYNIRNDSKWPKICRLHKENSVINEKLADKSIIISAIFGRDSLLNSIVVNLFTSLKRINEQFPLSKLKLSKSIKLGKFGTTS